MSKGGAKKYRIKNLVAIVYPVPSIISTTFRKTFLLFFPFGASLISLSFLPFSLSLQQHRLYRLWLTTTGSRSRRASVLVWKTIEAKAAVPKLSGDAQPASGLLMQAVLQRVWLSCLTLLAGRSVSCCISHGSPFLLQEPFYSSQMQGGFQRF